MICLASMERACAELSVAAVGYSGGIRQRKRRMAGSGVDVDGRSGRHVKRGCEATAIKLGRRPATVQARAAAAYETAFAAIVPHNADRGQSRAALVTHNVFGQNTASIMQHEITRFKTRHIICGYARLLGDRDQSDAVCPRRTPPAHPPHGGGCPQSYRRPPAGAARNMRNDRLPNTFAGPHLAPNRRTLTAA